MKATRNVRPEFALLNDPTESKPKKFRDRRTHEQRTKEKLKTEEKSHPVHEPYKRQKKQWDKDFLEEEKDD